jgi:hypothetical protein
VSGALRIERIRLADFRGVRGREVRFAERGVTVVEGPNESGKSSLGDALDLLIDLKDSSKHRDVASAQPVGSDAGPLVEADLRAGPYRFTYRKRWIRDRETFLAIHAPVPEQVTGDAAHDRVLEILGEHADLGLWRALRLLQGEKVGQADVSAGGSLGSALERAAGGSDPTEEGSLFERARAESERYYTATRRPKEVLTRADAGVVAAAAAVDALRAAIAAVETDASVLARTTAELAGLRETLATQEAAARDRQARVAEVERLASASQIRKADHDAAIARADEVRSAATRRASLLAALAEAARRRDELAAGDAAATDVQSRLDAALDAAGTRLAAAREARARAADALARRRADRDLLRDGADLASLQERKGRLDRHADEGRAAQAAVDTNPVTDDVLQAIEDAVRRAGLAQARLETGAGEVRIVALAAVEPRVDGTAVPLAAGAEVIRPIGEGVEVEVSGLVRLIARPGTSAVELRAAVAAADTALAATLAAGGIADVAEARARNAERRSAEETARRARDAAMSILAGERLTQLEQRIVTLQARIAGSETERPPDQPVPADATDATELLDAADTADRAAATELDIAGDAERAARAAADAERAAGQERRVELGVATALAAETATALAAERERIPDDQLAARMAAAEQEARVAGNARAEADALLAQANPEQARVLAENAVRALDGTRARQQQLTVDQARLAGSLERHGEDGLGEALEVAEGELERARDALDRLQRRARASRLLLDTLQRHRDAAYRRYALPLRERLESLGRIVFGPDVVVEVSDGLTIATLTRAGVTIGWDQLSVGAREQLGVLTRVACAEIVAPDGGVPVVLDDALGWSDPQRLEAMGAVLARAGETTQVIVLTCFPDRYMHVGGATVVRVG